MNKENVLKEFQKIPWVGKTISQDLWDLGLRSIADLKDKDPQLLYEKLCALQNCRVDRCMLYVLRLAVYFASEKKPDEKLLKWWNWKDKEYF